MTTTIQNILKNLSTSTVRLTKSQLDEPESSNTYGLMERKQNDLSDIVNSLDPPILDINPLDPISTVGDITSFQYRPPQQNIIQGAQLGGTITQHPEKQGFERGVTAAGFPTQEQMTGLGFRQGPASYKPQKYAHGEEVIQTEQPPVEQLPTEQLPVEQLPTEQPPEEKNAAVQQMGNIEAAKEQDLSMPPQVIADPTAAPSQQTADDVEKTVPEGSFVINSAAVKIAGLDYIEEIVIDALKVAVDKGINIVSIGGAKGKEAVDILISNGEVIIPPELVGIIGEHTLKLINDKGIAAMKKKEQAETGQPQSGEYGGGQAYGGFIDMKQKQKVQ